MNRVVCRAIVAVLCLVQTASVVAGNTESLTCSNNICSQSEFGLFCPDGGLIHIFGVKCYSSRGADCVVARRNLFALCAGQNACAAHGLRKLFRACRSGQSPTVTVDYTCLPSAMIINSCNGDEDTKISASQAVITSPNFSNSSSDIAYNHCYWSFFVPQWKEAEINVYYLTAHQSERTCTEPLLRVRYDLCTGGGVKTLDFCGFLTNLKRSRACGKVRISARGFEQLHGLGTRFILSFRVTDPGNISDDRIVPVASLPCGGHPPTFSVLTPRSMTEKGPDPDSPTLSTLKNKDKSHFSQRYLLIVILVIAGIVIVVLLLSFIVVCYKATNYGDYRKDKAVARRRSRESSTSRTGRVSSRHGGSSIEDDIDDDLMVKEGGTMTSERPHSDILTGYVINSNGDAKNGRRPKSDFTYSSYSSIDDVTTPLPYTTGGTRSSLGDLNSFNYESLDSFNKPERKSVEEEYDNVPDDSREKIQTQTSVDGSLNGDSIPHYLINGDTYAIVTKPGKTLNGQINGKKLHFNESRDSGKSNSKNNKLKSPYSLESRYRNHVGYVEDSDDVF